MAVRGLDLDWTPHAVACAHCGAPLRRKLYLPDTGRPIQNFFCNNACKGPWQVRQRELATGATREWLVQKYEVEGLGCPEIAALVGRNPKQIFEWLKGHGITTRPRGSDERQHFQRGHRIGVGKKISEAHKEILRQARKRKPNLPHLTGGVHYLKGKRGPEVHTWRGGRTPERQAFYSSQEWKRACVIVWQSADAKCERCGLDSRTIPPRSRRFHVHHVIPFAFRRVRAEPYNLRLLCADCHRWVHSDANGDREFLPPFGILPLTHEGKTILVRISYRPKMKARLAPWLQPTC